jgi:hypothetical protein
VNIYTQKVVEIFQKERSRKNQKPKKDKRKNSLD